MSTLFRGARCTRHGRRKIARATNRCLKGYVASAVIFLGIRLRRLPNEELRFQPRARTVRGLYHHNTAFETSFRGNFNRSI
jgi:hypothetical protein